MMDSYNSPYSFDQHLSSIQQSNSNTPIFTRDFAYANKIPVILRENPGMATSEITELNAQSFAELLSGPTVDIYIGPERKHWSLPQNLLCHYSSYFEAELQGHEVPKPNRNGTATFDLPDEDPRGFALLVKWLYQGRLDDTTNLSAEEKYDYAVACHKLHSLSARFSLPSLKNLAIDAYRANLHSAGLVPDADDINEIYRSEPRGSPFRELMVRIAARQIMDPEVGRDVEAYRGCFAGDGEFAVGVVNAIRVMSGGMLLEDPTEGGGCVWHDHGDGGRCEERVEVIVDDGDRSLDFAQDPSPSTTIKVLSARPAHGRSNETLSQSLKEATSSSPTKMIAIQETPGPPNLTPNSIPRPSNTKPKPRKLDRTPAKATPPPINVTATANEARKLTPKPMARAPTTTHVVKTKLSQMNDRAVATAKPAVAATPTRALPRANDVNGIVRQFNSLNGHGAVSEASTSGSLGRRKPVKLKYKTGV